jgi:hypothetical protein
MIKYLMAVISAVVCVSLAADEVTTSNVEIEGVIYTQEELSQFSMILGYISAVSIKHPNIMQWISEDGGAISDPSGKTVLKGYDYFIENKDSIDLDKPSFTIDYKDDDCKGNEMDFLLGFSMALHSSSANRPQEFKDIPFYEEIFRKSMEEALDGVPMPPITIKYKEIFDELSMNPDFHMDVTYIEKGEE